MTNTQSLVEKAKLAGFSKVLGSEISQFVLLSRETDGRSGRKVFIDSALAGKFAAVVADDQANHVMNQLKQLRAIAGGITAHSNPANAFEHLHIIGDLKINYKVVQFSGNGSLAGVYITDVGFSQFAKGNKPGTYRVKHGDGKWYIGQNDSDSITTKNIAINGLCSSKKHAGQEIMPSMVLEAYGKRDGESAIKNEGFSLFYNPLSKVSDGVEWKTPEQKTFNSQFTAGLLSNTLLKSQMSGKKVQWTIHGDGANLFGAAIQRLVGKDLSNHEVIFLAPTNAADMPNILANMNKSKINLHEDVMKYHEDDWSGLAHRTYNSRAIAREVSKFQGRETVAEVLKAKGLTSSIAALSWVKYAATIGFCSVLAYKSVRNMAAQSANITDTAVNPHFHPFKDKEQFNVHAKIATGNKQNNIVFTELVKKIRNKVMS